VGGVFADADEIKKLGGAGFQIVTSARSERYYQLLQKTEEVFDVWLINAEAS
jgi:hypothetical protein